MLTKETLMYYAGKPVLSKKNNTEFASSVRLFPDLCRGFWDYHQWDDSKIMCKNFYDLSF